MIKSVDEIYYEMRQEFTARSGVNLRDDGDMAIRLRALAAQAHSLWIQNEWLGRQCFPQTASGLYLDYHAQLRGLERGSGVRARGEIRFEISAVRSVALQVPAGTVCATDSGTEFETTNAATIEPGALFCDAPAVARQPGADGNAPSDSILLMIGAPVGIESCHNPVPFYGGVDAESDSDLRNRVIGSYRLLPNGANVAYYETQALSVEGVAAASVIPKIRGRGTVDIVISSDEGIPDYPLIAAVSEKLGSQREICVDLLVEAPTVQKVDLSLRLKTGDNWDFSAVALKAEAAIKEYFSGQLLATDILLAVLGKLVYDIEGVSNYKIVEPSADIKIGKKILPILGALSISEMGS